LPFPLQGPVDLALRLNLARHHSQVCRCHEGLPYSPAMISNILYHPRLAAVVKDFLLISYLKPNKLPPSSAKASDEHFENYQPSSEFF
jgi:hypothetical protein